jgi:hypothetical protein
MYATSSPGGVYHLLATRNDLTLCGLSVAPIVIDRPVTTSSLHLTSQRPEEGELCKDCAEIELARCAKAQERMNK